MKKLLSFILLLSLLSLNTFTFASDGNKSVNVFVRDQAWNIQNTPWNSGIILDTTYPVINIVNNVDSTHTNNPKVITANIIETNLKYSKYSLINSSGVCDSSTNMTNDYESWTDLVFSNENFNGKKVCFKVEDMWGNITYSVSNIIENIDTIKPSEPSYNYSYQDWYNTISFKWSCTYEPGLKFIVESNGSIIHEESLSNPCVIDFTYTLSAPPLVHNIKYYLLDPAGNKTNEKSFKAYVDNIGYLITPANNVTVTPIISFMWFTSTPNADIKIKKIWGDYIANWKADSKWYFILQTSQSQPLWNMQIDLEINWVLRWDIRNIEVASSSIIVPTFTNEDDIKRSNTKLITAEIKWNPLSYVRMYSRDQDGNRLELWETALDSNGNWIIPSSVQLPGGENIIYIQDTIYNVSSQILLIIVVDPFWYVYDSISKEKISWVKVTVTDCNGNIVSLPLLHWQPQPNPMITDTNWYYDSYELPGTYCIKAEKEWYKWPSDIVLSWSVNLDWSPNIWSHWQSFLVVNDPIHIDIPMDKVEVKNNISGGWWWGINTYDYRYSANWWKSVTSLENKKMEIKYPGWIKTLTKTYNYGFESLFIENDWYYRFMYHKWNDIKEIEFNRSVEVSITDLDFANQSIMYKTSDDQEWKKLTGYIINWKTINFSIDRWFILRIDYENKFLERKEISWWSTIIEIKEWFKKYPIKNFEVSIIDYTKIYWKNKKIFEQVWKMNSEIVLQKFPWIFWKIEKLVENKKISKSNKLMLQVFYNHLWSVYLSRYGDYIKQVALSN